MATAAQKKADAAKAAAEAAEAAKKAAPADDLDLEFDPQRPVDAYPDTSGPIPEGWHSFSITRARLTKSKAGNPMQANRYTVIGKENPHEGKSLRDWIVYTKGRNGFGKLSALCQAVDPDMQSYARDPEAGFNHNDQASIDFHLLGQVFAGRIEHEFRSYIDPSGKKVEKTDERLMDVRLLSDRELATLQADYGGEPRPPLPEDARLDWDVKPDRGFGSGGSAAGGGGGGRNEASPRRDPGDFHDDEIPF